MKDLLRYALIAVTVSISVIGCAAPEPPPSNHDLEDIDVGYEPFLTADDGLLTGTIGPVVDVDSFATINQVYDDGSYASVELAAQVDAEHAAMLFLSIQRPDEVLIPNTSLIVFDDDVDFSNINLLGCAGQTIDTYDIYDRTATSITLDVIGVPNSTDVIISVTGTWEGLRVGEATTTASGQTRLSRSE